MVASRFHRMYSDVTGTSIMQASSATRICRVLCSPGMRRLEPTILMFGVGMRSANVASLPCWKSCSPVAQYGHPFSPPLAPPRALTLASWFPFRNLGTRRKREASWTDGLRSAGALHLSPDAPAPKESPHSPASSPAGAGFERARATGGRAHGEREQQQPGAGHKGGPCCAGAARQALPGSPRRLQDSAAAGRASCPR